MSLSKRTLDREEAAERLNRGAADVYYGEPWPSEAEAQADQRDEDHEQGFHTY